MDFSVGAKSQVLSGRNHSVIPSFALIFGRPFLSSVGLSITPPTPGPPRLLRDRPVNKTDTESTHMPPSLTLSDTAHKDQA